MADSVTVEAIRVAEVILLAVSGMEVLSGASGAGARLAGDTTTGWPRGQRSGRVDNIGE